MRYEKVTIDPDMAMQWLDQNTHNRPIRATQVRYFERLLKTDKAATTHQGVAFDETGKLLDGQHRLTAIRNTGIPWTMWVAFDCHADDFNKIDVGAKRTIADRLHIHGRKNASHVAAVGKFAWNWYHGNAAFTGQPDDTQINDLIELYPSLGDAPKINIKGCGVPQSLLSFLCYLGPADFVDEFQLALEGGEDSRSDTSAAKLAAKYKKWKADAKHAVPKTFIAWFIIAANDQISGREPRTVSFRESQPFPRPLWNPPIPFEAVIDDDDDEA